MNLYPYIPPFFSIYLIVVSHVVTGYAKHLIPDPVRRNTALDWEARITFISSMLGSLVSLYSIFETSQSYAWLTASGIALIVILGTMFFWIISHGAGELATIRTKTGGLLHMTVCALVLVLVNFLLICAIGINQHLTHAKAPQANVDHAVYENHVRPTFSPRAVEWVVSGLG